jgi:hypothetical protein
MTIDLDGVCTAQKRGQLRKGIRDHANPSKEGNGETVPVENMLFDQKLATSPDRVKPGVLYRGSRKEVVLEELCKWLTTR